MYSVLFVITPESLQYVDFVYIANNHFSVSVGLWVEMFFQLFVFWVLVWCFIEKINLT